MAYWQDATGAAWVLVPFWGPVSKSFHAPVEYARPATGGVAAYRLEEKTGKWQLTPAWLSRDMDLAEEVVVANGVAFTYAAGEDGTQVAPDAAWNEPAGAKYGGGLSSGSIRRVANSRHAAMYALDALTGKELWSSGNQISSWNHFSGLTVANGRAYIGTFDGMLYCFGVAATK
jgi:outer membrane protein assembly factor BamB